jgi:hypothetical protein
MSSHREAPEISKDPVADSTDVYAFVSPDRPDTVTLIANYIPLEAPAGGPNFYEFGDDVRYEIHIDNNGDGNPDVTYEFRFTTEVRNQNTFLYNTGPILKLDSPNWNRRQFYSVTRRDARGTRQLATRLPCPPCNIGPLSTPNYPKLADAAVRDLGRGRKVFAGQRAEGFYVDLGAIFDLLNPRPFADLHETFGLAKFPKSGAGVNATKDFNVHSIALQVPISDLTREGYRGKDPADPRAVIGVWTTASRQRVRMLDEEKSNTWSTGPHRQVSRLANPLFNEVIVPMGQKDFWNTQTPAGDSRFARFVAKPEVAQLLPVLFPGVFPNLDVLNKVRQATRRPARDPPHRYSGRPDPRIPEFHRRDTSGPHAAQHRHSAHPQTERLRPARRRPRRLPERAAGVRRRGRDRAACRRRRHLPVGGQELHPRPGRRAGRRRGHPGQPGHPVPGPVPVSRRAEQRVPHPGEVRFHNGQPGSRHRR